MSIFIPLIFVPQGSLMVVFDGKSYKNTCTTTTIRYWWLIGISVFRPEQYKLLWCWTINHILLDTASIDSRQKLDTGVSYSKMGGGVIDTTCQRASKMLYEIIAVSLFPHLPTPALLAARSCSHVMLTVTLARSLVLRSSPWIFKQKRDCSQSKWNSP